MNVILFADEFSSASRGFFCSSWGGWRIRIVMPKNEKKKKKPREKRQADIDVGNVRVSSQFHPSSSLVFFPWVEC